MKTTVEISDPLLDAAKAVAASEETTVRALIEEGLRRILAERSQRRPFRLRAVTFRGNGLAPGVREGDWDQLRDLVYDGHGA
jgi:hypothetical protein